MSVTILFLFPFFISCIFLFYILFCNCISQVLDFERSHSKPKTNCTYASVKRQTKCSKTIETDWKRNLLTLLLYSYSGLTIWIRYKHRNSQQYSVSDRNSAELFPTCPSKILIAKFNPNLNTIFRFSAHLKISCEKFIIIKTYLNTIKSH